MSSWFGWKLGVALVVVVVINNSPESLVRDLRCRSVAFALCR